MAELKPSKSWPPGKDFDFRSFRKSCQKRDRKYRMPNGQIGHWCSETGRVVFFTRIDGKLKRTNAAGQVL